MWFGDHESDEMAVKEQKVKTEVPERAKDLSCETRITNILMNILSI